MRNHLITGILLMICATSNGWAERPTVRAGVLKFGTVNWELQTIKNYHLDQAEGFNLEVVPFAGKLATATALHGGAVDVIVNDWIWVSRQRSERRSYGFIPYSRMNGALMVAPNSNINELKDLRGKKIGIAGGPVDKNWLLIQALARKQMGSDFTKSVDHVYGAPPLLSKKLENGELDAVITFWHYAVKLETVGAKRLIDIAQTLNQLGMNDDLPMIGYVFTPEFTREKADLILAFNRASRKAKEILAQNSEAWLPIRPMMKVNSEQGFKALKSGFLKGAPTHWGETERSEAKTLYKLLAEIGGSKLVGKTHQLAPGTFIDNVHY